MKKSIEPENIPRPKTKGVEPEEPSVSSGRAVLGFKDFVRTKTTLGLFDDYDVRESWVWTLHSGGLKPRSLRWVILCATRGDTLRRRVRKKKIGLTFCLLNCFYFDFLIFAFYVISSLIGGWGGRVVNMGIVGRWGAEIPSVPLWFFINSF